MRAHHRRDHQPLRQRAPDQGVARPLQPERLHGARTLQHLEDLAGSPADRFTYASELAEALEPLLIAKGRMFGAKSARAFMQMLYADDITFLADRMRDYASIGDADVTAVALEDTPRTRAVKGGPSEQVFETDFGRGRMHSQSTAIDPSLGKTERNDLSPQKTMQFAGGGVPTSQFDAKTEIFDQIDIDVGTPVARKHGGGRGLRSASDPRQRSFFARRWGILLGSVVALVLFAAVAVVLAARQGLLPAAWLRLVPEKPSVVAHKPVVPSPNRGVVRPEPAPVKPEVGEWARYWVKWWYVMKMSPASIAMSSMAIGSHTTIDVPNVTVRCPLRSVLQRILDMP